MAIVWLDFDNLTCIEHDIVWDDLETVYDYIAAGIDGIYIVTDQVSGEVYQTLIGSVDEEEKELLLGMV